MEIACNLGLHERTAILGGIIVPRSLGMLRYMHSAVAGVSVPKALMDRMRKAQDSAKTKKGARLRQEEEGIKIAVELIEQVREIPGIKGIHLQAIEWERKVPEILKRAGLLPRPVVEETQPDEPIQEPAVSG